MDTGLAVGGVADALAPEAAEAGFVAGDATAGTGLAKLAVEGGPVSEGGELVQGEFGFVDDLNAQRQGYAPLPAGEEPYQLSLFPDSAYDRVNQYGGSTTPEQQSLAAPFSFDHDPSLVEHYYEGNGQGGLPGFNLTQTEREQQFESLIGNIVTRKMQNVQGRQLRDYSIQQKRNWGL